MGVDHEQDGVCLGNSRTGLDLDLGLESGARLGIQPGGIDQQDPAAEDRDLLSDAVPGYAGQVLHQRASVSGVSVE